MSSLSKLCIFLAIMLFECLLNITHADTTNSISSQTFSAQQLVESVDDSDMTSPLKLFLTLTALSFIPAVLIAMTSFTRFVIVFSMLRFALGLQQTPPNSVLITLSLFMTLFTMYPAIEIINEKAWQPYQAKELSIDEAMTEALQPIRLFMIKQTREKDLAMIINMTQQANPESIDDIKTPYLIPAFMLSELRTAFKIAFIIFLPFLLIDLVVASTLMSLGMIMVPPMTVALPLKVLLFVLIDGWSLIVQSLLASF